MRPGTSLGKKSSSHQSLYPGNDLIIDGEEKGLEEDKAGISLFLCDAESALLEV